MLSGLGFSLIAWSGTWCNVGALRCKSLPKGNGNVHVPFFTFSARSLLTRNGNVHGAILVLSELCLSIMAMERYTLPFCCSHSKGSGKVHGAIVVLSLLSLYIRALEGYMVSFWCCQC